MKHINHSETTIISIDPGYERLGLAVLFKNPTGKINLIHSECFRTSSKDLFSERLLQIGQKLMSLIETYKPSVCVLENLFMQNNQKTVMHVSEARGVLTYVAKNAGLKTYDFTPLQIKSAITGNGRSDKTSVQKMIPLLLPELNITEKKLDDEYDAIACGLTYFALEKSL